MHKMRWGAAACGLGLALLASPDRSPGKAAQSFTLQPNDHICIIGNTLGERMQYDGWLETHAAGCGSRSTSSSSATSAFSGDEIDTRLRSKNFGTPDEWLSGLAEPVGGYEDNRFAGTNTNADVIFAFFGYNESYARRAGLEAFKKDLAAWLTHSLRRSTTARPRRASCSSRRSRMRISEPGSAGRQGEQPAARALHQGDGRRGAKRQRRRPSSTCSRRALKLYADIAEPLTMQGVHLNERRQPADRPRSSTARSSATRRRTTQRS